MSLWCLFLLMDLHILCLSKVYCWKTFHLFNGKVLISFKFLTSIKVISSKFQSIILKKKQNIRKSIKSNAAKSQKFSCWQFNFFFIFNWIFFTSKKFLWSQFPTDKKKETEYLSLTFFVPSFYFMWQHNNSTTRDYSREILDPCCGRIRCWLGLHCPWRC